MLKSTIFLFNRKNRKNWHRFKFQASRLRLLDLFQILSVQMGQKGSKDRLSKQDLEFLKTSTRYDENTIKDWYKGFKSDCPDGRLTPAAFMQIYSKCFPTGNANEFCDHVFRTFDTDKNGFIDFKEFLLAIDVTSSGCPEEKLNWAFRYVQKIICLKKRFWSLIFILACTTWTEMVI